jgi:hypothetical protein
MVKYFSGNHFQYFPTLCTPCSPRYPYLEACIITLLNPKSTSTYKAKTSVDIIDRSKFCMVFNFKILFEEPEAHQRVLYRVSMKVSNHCYNDRYFVPFDIHKCHGWSNSVIFGTIVKTRQESIVRMICIPMNPHLCDPRSVTIIPNTNTFRRWS